MVSDSEILADLADEFEHDKHPEGEFEDKLSDELDMMLEDRSPFWIREEVEDTDQEFQDLVYEILENIA